MIDILIITISYLVPWYLGWVVVSLLDKHDNLAYLYKLAVSFLIGIGLMTTIIFIYTWTGGNLVGRTLLPMMITPIILLEIIHFKFKSEFSFKKCYKEVKKIKEIIKWKKLNLILLTLLVIYVLSQSVLGAYQIIHNPTYDFDAWNNWNLRPKVIYTQHQLPMNKPNEFFLGGGIKSYPLNDPLLKVWQASLLTKWNENVINLYSLVFYIALIFLFYQSLPKIFSRTIKLISTYLLASLPFLVLHSRIAYADLEITSFIFLAYSALFMYLQTRDKPYLYISAFGLAFSIWTKNEGFALVLPSLIIFMIFLVISKQLRFKTSIKYLLTSLFIVSPWLLFRWLYDLDVLSGDSSSFNMIFQVSEFTRWFSLLLFRSHFSFLLIALFIIMILKIKDIYHSQSLQKMTFAFLLLFALYNFVFMFTDKSQSLNAMIRANMQIIPIAVLLLISYINKFFAQNR
ncbi:glycosyltransferase family 39 protein [Patescibacteria group bacterium]|nr:glycosyltransferase family 39 protein [Patescibacteria group bacterium]